MKRISCLLAVVLFSSQVLGSATFEKRFKIVRDDQGRVVSVKEPGLKVSFSIAPYLQQIKENLKQEQLLMKQKGDYDAEIEELLISDIEDKGDKSSENIAYVVRSLRALENIDVEGVFNAPEFKNVISAYEKKMSDAISYLDPTIIAKPDNSRFFYKRHVTYQVVTWGLNFAKKRLSSIPILNTASYVLVEVERMIRERRLYHQNMLLHYLELFSETDLGFTKVEADEIFSSIYESQIPWYAKWESDSAANNWESYGANKFYTNFRAGTSKLRANSRRYSSIDTRLNFAFQEVVADGEEQIVNLVNKESMFNSKPGVAFIKSSPAKVRRKRMVLQLAGLGVSFLPLPDFIKNIAASYMKSFYEDQKITEGALFAHFEVEADREMQIELKKQYLNPFDNTLLLD